MTRFLYLLSLLKKRKERKEKKGMPVANKVKKEKKGFLWLGNIGDDFLGITNK